MMIIERIKKFLDSKRERRYNTEGTITFIYIRDGKRILGPIQFAEIRKHILEVDKQFPWIDGDLPSIGFLSGGNIVTHVLNSSEQHIWYKIIPGAQNLEERQRKPYERYLTKLAEELFKRELFGTTSVRVVLKTVSSTYFK